MSPVASGMECVTRHGSTSGAASNTSPLFPSFLPSSAPSRAPSLSVTAQRPAPERSHTRSHSILSTRQLPMLSPGCLRCAGSPGSGERDAKAHFGSTLAVMACTSTPPHWLGFRARGLAAALGVAIGRSRAARAGFGFFCWSGAGPRAPRAASPRCAMSSASCSRAAPVRTGSGSVSCTLALVAGASVGSLRANQSPVAIATITIGAPHRMSRSTSISPRALRSPCHAGSAHICQFSGAAADTLSQARRLESSALPGWQIDGCASVKRRMGLYCAVGCSALAVSRRRRSKAA